MRGRDTTHTARLTTVNKDFFPRYKQKEEKLRQCLQRRLSRHTLPQIPFSSHSGRVIQAWAQVKSYYESTGINSSPQRTRHGNTGSEDHWL